MQIQISKVPKKDFGANLTPSPASLSFKQVGLQNRIAELEDERSKLVASLSEFLTQVSPSKNVNVTPIQLIDFIKESFKGL